ncbi:MAG: dinitrogenase iron-molybdenum cofactor biosynthesis protein [Desulfovibrio sp.]|nr:dinitrogenase iron-molybdenum cofactor biosynthesis protein [Desulfovibrio sp.]
MSDASPHPCFAVGARAQAGRIHLPVAVRSTIRRRFGEPETPGRALSPKDVIQWLERVLAEGTDISMVGITGPGEPLAEPGPTFETLRAVREKHPELALTLATNGLGAAEHAPALAELGLSHVTVLVDAVDPLLVEQLYAWIRPGTRTVALPEAARLLVDEQARAIRAFREAGLFVKVNMTVIAGINEDHVADVASVVATLGADMLALAPFHPACCDPAAPKAPEAARMEELRAEAGRYIAIMPAPSCGSGSCGQSIVGVEHGSADLALLPSRPRPTGARVNVAVASAGGLDVDLHLGQAMRFLIFGPRAGDGLPSLLGSREAPEPGNGDTRWEALAEALHDCFAILAASAGAHPRELLAAHGLTVLTGEAQIQGAVDALLGGGPKCGKGNGKKRVKAN